jgi:hypothetical protein
MQGLEGLPQALQRFFETLTGSHSMQGKWVVILAVAAFLAGLCGKRLRARPRPSCTASTALAISTSLRAANR